MLTSSRNKVLPKLMGKLFYRLKTRGLEILFWSSDSSVYPEGDMNVCTKFYCNKSNSCWNIWLQTTNDNLLEALDESQGITKVNRIQHLRTMNFCTNIPNTSTSSVSVSAVLHSQVFLAQSWQQCLFLFKHWGLLNSGIFQIPPTVALIHLFT